LVLKEIGVGLGKEARLFTGLGLYGLYAQLAETLA
jgi:hypothetical protein